jgi:16S rRNA (guanine527-N7)-methyltransferase
MFHVKHEGSTPDPLSDRQASDLHLYESLLRSDAIPRGLVAKSDREDLWNRHIADSLRAVSLIPHGASRACDLGSGAGLPGIPIAIAGPFTQVVLAEARRARAAFLELAVERLRLSSASVHAGRAETLEPEFDVCLARGFADAAGCWEIADRLLLPGGCLMYWAGVTFEQDEVPGGASAVATGAPTLESGGPIVIMTRR